MSSSESRAAAPLLALLVLGTAATRSPDVAHSSTPTVAPAPGPVRCRLTPLCLCHHEHFICNDVPFYHFPEIDEGVVHVSISGARLDALQEAALTSHALHTLQLLESGVRALHPGALLPAARSLASLDLAHNLLAELPLAALRPLRALHWLNLQNNRIGSLQSETDWGGLADTLTTLSLSDNEVCVVERGALSGLRRLVRLDLQGNRVRALPPAALPPALAALHLDGNLLPAAPCDPLPRLQLLRLRDNALHVGPPAPCAEPRSRRLDTLDLAHNQLTAAQLSSVLRDVTTRHLVLDLNSLSALPAAAYERSRLERLSAAHNRLASLPAAALRHLRPVLRLELDRNMLAELPPAVRGLARCRVLSLAYNRLTEVRALPPNLRVLNLAGNYLTAWPKELTRLTAGQLRQLDLSYNRLESVDLGAWGAWAGSLEHLDLRGNRLVILASTSPLSSRHGPPLRELLLGFTEVRALAAGALAALAPTLRALELTSSRLGEEFPAGAMLHHLEWLSLDDSEVRVVTSRDLAALPALEYLNLDFNKLERFPSDYSPPQEWRPRLRVLRLAYNQVREIEWTYVSALSELSNLDLTNNRVNALPSQALAGLRQLRLVSLAGNPLVRLAPRALRHLPALRRLYLQGNLLTELSVTSFEHVGDPDGILLLNVSHNRISKLTGCDEGTGAGTGDDGPLWVTELDLSHNRIGHVSQSFFESVASRLRRVDLSHNLLTRLELPSFTPPALPPLALLETLIVRHNNVSMLHPLAAPALTVLDLGYNAVRALGRDALAGAALQNLDLSHNRIAEFPAAALAAAGRTLRRLDLAANALEHLDAPALAPLRALRDLTLRDNALTVLPDNTFGALPRLRLLDLARNALEANFKELFHNLPELRRLSLAGCGLRAVPPLPLRNLTALDLSDNRVAGWRDAALRAIPALRELSLAGNLLMALRPGAWAAAPRLVTLHLGGNPLLSLPAGAFEHLARLQRLHLAPSPHLRTVDERALRPLRALRALELEAGAAGTGVAGGVTAAALLRHAVHVEALTLQVRGARLDEQLAGVGAHKLRAVVVRGRRLREVSAEALAALGESRVLAVRLADTAVAELPAGLLAPLARVPHLALQLVDNRRLAALPPALLQRDPPARPTALLPGGLTLSGNALRCACGAAWLGAWLRRWAVESGEAAGAAAREAVCLQRDGGMLALVALHGDPAECAASALSSLAATLPHCTRTAAALPALMMLLQICR